MPIILFLSLLNPTSGEHILNSTSLYFNTFEFNGSFYSLIRWIGYKVKGYNVIREIAPWLTFSTALLMISISVIHLIRPFRSVFIFFTLTLTIYFLLATTVNPWYIAPILAFGLFTPYHYPLAWSFLVFLSYQAFSTPDFNVPPILLIGEYGFLFLIMAIDYISNKNEINSENPNSLSR